MTRCSVGPQRGKTLRFIAEHTAGNHRSLLHPPHVIDVVRRITEFAPGFVGA